MQAPEQQGQGAPGRVINTRWTQDNTRALRSSLTGFITEVSALARRDEELREVSPRGDDGGRAAGSTEALAQEARRVQEKEFRVPVVAMMKCGKSTFMDCVMRRALLPEDVLPETSAIVTIMHDARASTPELYRSTLQADASSSSSSSGALARGDVEVYQFIKDLNAFLRELGQGRQVSSDRFDENMRRLVLRTSIPSLAAYDLREVRFALMDTPGVNEYNATIAKTTQELLQLADVVIYILDITRLGAVDEHNFLVRMVSERPDLLAEGRTFFILNKLDMVNFKPEEIERGKQYIKNFLHEINPQLAALADANTFSLATAYYLIPLVVMENRVTVEKHLTEAQKWIYGMFPPPGGMSLPVDAQASAALQRIMAMSAFAPAEEAIFSSLAINAPCLFATAVVGNLQRACGEIKTQVSLRQALWSLGRDKAEQAANALRETVEIARGYQQWLMERVESESRALAEMLAQRREHLLQAVDQVVSQAIASASSSFVPMETKEAATRNLSALFGSLVSGVRASICLEKARQDMALRQRLEDCKRESENRCRSQVHQVIINCLRPILTPEQVEEIGRQLDIQPTWQEYQLSDWNGSNIDVPALTDAYIKDVVQTVQDQQARLIPARTEMREFRSGGGGGGGGGNPLSSVMTGATFGSKFGPWGAAIGGVIGGIFGGGRRKESTSVVRVPVEVEAAKLVYDTVDKQVTKYTVDYESVKVAASRLVDSTVDGFIEWYMDQANQALNAIQTSVHDHYIRRLSEITTGLERDSNQHAADARTKEEHLQGLAQVAAEADRLLSLLSRPIEEIIRIASSS